MDTYFFDTSALIKVYAREAGTAWVLNLSRRSSGNTIFIARIAPVESAAGLAKQQLTGALTDDEFDNTVSRLMRSVEERFAFVEISKRLVSFAVPLVRRYALRGFDAIHLAAALDVSFQRTSVGLEKVIFVSSDDRLNHAALAENLRVENPNDHP